MSHPDLSKLRRHIQEFEGDKGRARRKKRGKALLILVILAFSSYFYLFQRESVRHVYSKAYDSIIQFVEENGPS